MHLTWTKPADLLDEVGIYTEVVNFLQKRVNRRARLILWNFTVVENKINHDFFSWIEQNVLPLLASVKIQKISYVIANDLFPNDNKTLTINNTKIELKIFNSEPQAVKWLLENAPMKKIGLPSHKHHKK